MKIKLENILKSRSALIVLNNTRFKSTVSYCVMKNLKAIAEEEKLYEKQRIKICKDFSNKDEKGNAIVKDNRYDIPESKKEEYLNEIESLKEMTIDIPIVKLSLGDIEAAMLSPAQLDSIEYMLEV